VDDKGNIIKDNIKLSKLITLLEEENVGLKEQTKQLE
jgi:hypothetical protein